MSLITNRYKTMNVLVAALIMGTFPSASLAQTREPYSQLWGCILIIPGTGIENKCDYPVEANWIDSNGGRNMVTLQPRGQYSVRNVQRAAACKVNDGYDWSKMTCR